MAQESFFERMRSGLQKTRDTLQQGLDSVLSRNRADAETLEELEEVLIMADLGAAATQKVIQEVEHRVRQHTIAPDGEGLREGVVETISEILQAAAQSSVALREAVSPEARPWVMMLVGVNGVGKTTTLGKLAHQFRDMGERPLIVAADTFRAAAIEQAEIWAQRAGVDIIKGQAGGDAAAVAYDALQAAQARQLDRVLIDTAGRLHNKAHLMDELKKMRRVLARAMPEAPHDVWLVLDATTGQNAVSQVAQFHEHIGLTGLVLTKLDSTAKGGIVVNIADQFQLPIRYIGIGEGIDDLRPFEATSFAQALLA
ncbi:MAG: cell division protein FtsY [Candidatus Entotheonella factor]|uniref:Signal recognition particle receptor FtsY n=1 Tax=Entotheonella factor TaxID=1429438 RepID=W4LYV4_ENTF1|nr:signal recognition particle-docking protein FtsY [Candidatus Entotheonella palauensis]ETX03083.1 MAG: cell division protein FtsY [Candidatus Entotheonella factor]